MPPDTIDIEQEGALVAYLRGRGDIEGDKLPAITLLSGGVSNKALMVVFPNGDSWVVKQALPKLRVQDDWFSDPRRIHQEALGLTYARALLPEGTVPELIFEDQEQHILAMRAVPRPHENWKTMLLRGDLSDDHLRQFGSVLASLHNNGVLQQGRMREIFFEYTYFETLRLAPYYEFTASKVPEAREFLLALCESTRGVRETVVHGDFSPKNVLIHQNRLVLLDFEVIHFGDPAFDIGFSMAHLLSKAHFLAPHRERYTAAARDYWHVYTNGFSSKRSPAEFEHRCVRHMLACLLARVAGKSQLEYLSMPQRERQAVAVLNLIKTMPKTVLHLIEQFNSNIERD
jgi:tRNA A-37 threonylcarbamoyl transferase component Bud32